MHQPLLLDGTLDQLQQLRIRPMAWSCLGGGRLFNDDYFQPLRDELTGCGGRGVKRGLD